MAKGSAKKSKRGINALDVVIILLIICLVGALGYRIYKGVSNPDLEKASKYIVEYECDEIFNSVADYVESGDAIYFAQNGELLGYAYIAKDSTEVLEIVTEEIEGGAESENSEDEEPISYEKVKAIGKLKLNADATYMKNGDLYEVGGISLTKGSVVEVYTAKASFTLRITNVYVIE